MSRLVSFSAEPVKLTVSLTELRRHLDFLMDIIEEEGAIGITRRGKVVAYLIAMHLVPWRR